MKRTPSTAAELYAQTMWSIFRWPIWWYSEGLVWAGKKALASVRMYARMLAIDVWVRNFFVPMFGAHDWQSRLISIFMRFVQIVGRSFFLMFWTLGMLVLFFAYLIAPVLAVFGFLWNLFGIVA